ncbi:hypothetical protein 035JT004_257 [Bacillus phage 035JT004]|nr:hypothetical protein 035JT004_257 [Bacillus phage 035JT004]
MSSVREGIDYKVTYAKYKGTRNNSSWTEYVWGLGLMDSEGVTQYGEFRTYYDYDTGTLRGNTVRFLLGIFRATDEDRVPEKLVIVLTNGEKITFSSSEAHKEYESLKFAYEIGEPFFELPPPPNGDSLVLNLSNVTHFFISRKETTDD